MNRFFQNKYIKSLLSATALILSSGSSNAQVASPAYTFSTSVGTYTEITGGTQLILSNETTSVPWDNETYTVTCPFTFTYSGAAYTQMTLSANGVVAMGNTIINGFPNLPISSSSNSNNVIAAFGRDLVGSHTFNGNTTAGSNVITGTTQTDGVVVGARIYGTGIPTGATVTGKSANTVTISGNATAAGTAIFSQFRGEIRWQVIGSSPNRTLVFQWKNARIASINLQHYNFQIRLNESDNSVEVVYGNCNFANTASSTAPQVGLRGSANTDYNNRLGNSTSGHNWNTTLAGTANSSTVSINALGVPPVSGRTFKWTPAPPSAIDIAVNSLVSPGVTCGSSAENVVVQIKNVGSLVHDFSVNPTTVSVNITGQLTQSVSATVSTGTLAANGTLNVTCTPPIDMDNNGTYNFACSHTTTGDVSLANNSLSSVSRVISRNSTFPYTETFAVTPNPGYVTQAIAPNVSNNWAILFNSTFEPGFSPPPSLNTVNNGFAVFSSYNFAAGTESRLILPCMDFSSITSPVMTISMAQNDDLSNRDDRVRIEVSTDGGNTWSFVPGAPTCNRYNAAATTMFWQDFSVCLSAYAGNPNVRLALRAIGENGYSMAVDQIKIEDTCPTVNTLSASGIGFTSATVNWNAIDCGASAFDVEYGPAPSGPYTMIPLGLVTSTNLTGLTSSTTYQYRVRTNCGGPVSPWSAFQTFSTLAAPPANDACPGSLLTPGLTCTYVAATTVNATPSAVATPTCGGNPDDDVWYNFVAPSNNVTINAQATSGIDLVVVLYQDNGCTTPAELACADATFAGGTESLNITTLTAGNTYRVRVYDKNAGATGTFNICATYVPNAPLNDNCGGAFTLTPGSSCTITAGTAEAATPSPQATACSGDPDDDVWYKFVASSTSVDITAVGAIGMDLVLELFDGSCGAPTNLACANLSGSGGTEVISQGGLVLGNTYLVRVYDFGSGYPSASTFDICVVNQTVLNPPPANDLCANAISLTSNPTCVTTAGTTLGATNSGLAGNLCGGFVANPDDDVWYSFVASSTAHDIIVSPSAPLNAVLELRNSGCNGNLIQCVDGAGVGGSETLSLQGLIIGTTYRIRVFGRGVGAATQGSFNICVVNGVVTPGPANDNCAAATVLTPSGSPTCSSPTNGTVLNATQSAPSTTCFGTNNDDVWFQFTATQSLHNVIVSGSAQFDAVVEAFSGACGASGISCMDITGNGGTETLSLTGLTAGTIYYVRVFDVNPGVPATLTFTICVTTPTIPGPPANDLICNATTISAANSCNPFLQNAAGATLSPQAVPSCGGTPNDDVWYKFTAAQTSAIVQATGQGTYDMTIAGYGGTCVSPVFLNCTNTNGPGQTESLVLSGLTIGQTYFIRIYDFASGTPSNSNISICVVNVIPPPFPVNDLCDDAIPLNCGNIAFGQNTVGATSTGDPSASCGGMSLTNMNGIWYRIFGTGDFFRLSTCNGTTFNTKIAVYSGNCTTPVCVASNDDFSGCGSGLQSQVSWQSVSGTDYFVLVGGVSGATGIFQLKFECFPCLNPTVAGTITVSPSPTVSTVNDTYTLALSGNTGNVVNWEFSLNPSFSPISNTEPSDGNNDLDFINRVNGTIYARAIVQNGPGCQLQTGTAATITPRCASTINNSPAATNHYITNVEFNTINNNSTYDASGDNYQNFQALSTTVQKGVSYQLKIKTFGTELLGRIAWLDINGDNVFNNTNENILPPQAPTAGTTNHIISIPCTGINGNVRLRVMVTNGTPSANACNTSAYVSGEIEEYTINVAGTGFGNWVGGTNDWCTASNWACNTVPNGSIDVTIPATAAQINLSCDATCRNINFQTVPPFFGSNGINTNGFKLNVKGNWSVTPSVNSNVSIVDPTVSAGSVEFNGNAGAQTLTGRTNFNNMTCNNATGNIILSGATSISGILRTTTGTLATNDNLTLRSVTSRTALVNPVGGTVTGNVTVERKIGSVGGYHYLSSPVANAFVNNTVSGWRDDFTILAALDGQVFIPGQVYTQLATVWEYNESDLNPSPNYGWIAATGTLDPITPLKGFACVVNANITVDVRGPLNNGTIPDGYTITKVTDGTNMIGNPYPSPISWNAFRLQNSSVLSTVGYKAFISAGGYSGSYASWDGSVGTNGLTDVIASSQGILATALTTGNINASNAIRNTSYADVSATYYNNSNVSNLFRMEVQGNGFANEMALYFDPTANDSYEMNRDATILYSPVPGFPNIYSVIDSVDLTINVMGELDVDKTIPLGVKIQTAGNYQLVLTDMSTFAPSVIAYLEDTQLDSMINLRNQPSYMVNLPVGNFKTRFILHFRPAVSFDIADETCTGSDGSVVVNYPSAHPYDVQIIASNGNVVSTLTGVSGQQTINNLPSGNYSAQLTFGTAPDVYSTVDYFSVAEGNSVTAALSASQNFVDINNNQSIDFIASSVGATTYNWNFGDGTIINNGPTNISHTFTQAGNYNVTYTATNGICSASATVAVEVVNTTGIADLAQSGMSIISNGDRLAIQFNKTAGSGTIEMFNMVGQRVYVNEQVLLKGTKQLTFDQLSVGQYIIKVTGRDQVFTQKVYISR